MAKNCVKTALLFLLILVGFTKVHAQKGADIESLAIDYYNEKEFKKALPLFSGLLDKYPSNKLINYYYGSTLVQLENFEDKVTDAFIIAEDGDVPLNVHYFAGKNYHALNEFDLAIQCYETFIRLAKKKERKAIDVDEITELAYEGVNPFAKQESTSEIATPPEKIQTGIVLARPGEKVSFAERDIESSNNTAKKEQSTIVLAQPSKKVDFSERQTPNEKSTASTAPNSTNTVIPQADVATPKVVIEPQSKEDLRHGINISFRINDILRYTYSGQFRDETAAKKFEEGWKSKKERESLSKQADELRKQYAKENNHEKRNQIARKILDFEQRTFPLIRKEETAFSSAQDLEDRYWSKRSEKEILAFAKTIQSLENEMTTVEEPKTEEQIIDRENGIVEKPKNDSPKVMEITNEVTYRIQIGAYKNTPPDYVLRQYKKLSMLRKIDKYIDNRNITVYTVGKTDNYKTATTLQNQIRQEGIKDAFVAAYLNGERISISKAKEVEKK